MNQVLFFALRVCYFFLHIYPFRTIMNTAKFSAMTMMNVTKLLNAWWQAQSRAAFRF